MFALNFQFKTFSYLAHCVACTLYGRWKNKNRPLWSGYVMDIQQASLKCFLHDSASENRSRRNSTAILHAIARRIFLDTWRLMYSYDFHAFMLLWFSWLLIFYAFVILCFYMNLMIPYALCVFILLFLSTISYDFLCLA